MGPLICQARLVKEVDELGTSWLPTYEALEGRLPYMDAVINESLRLFPPVWLTMREVETDVELLGKAFSLLDPCSANEIVTSFMCEAFASVSIGQDGWL